MAEIREFHIADEDADIDELRFRLARLDSFPQFVTEVDGTNVHFLHVASPNPDALPLLLHGWPGSVMEFVDVVEHLREDHHLVIPSIPRLRVLRGPPRRPAGTPGTTRPHCRRAT